MTYYYKCSRCNTQITTEHRRTVRCSTCNQVLALVAEEKWLFKCSNCSYTNVGNLSRGSSIHPCPMCDDGIVHPSRPY